MEEYIEGEEKINLPNRQHEIHQNVRRERIHFNYLPVYIIMIMSIFFAYIGFFYLLIYFCVYSYNRQRSNKEKNIIAGLFLITVFSLIFDTYNTFV